MRGGKREGAGRKPSEPTVRISVPVGVLDKVNALIQAYRQEVRVEETEAGVLLAKLQTLKAVPENKQPTPLPPQPVMPTKPTAVSKPLANAQHKGQRPAKKRKKRR